MNDHIIVMHKTQLFELVSKDCVGLSNHNAPGKKIDLNITYRETWQSLQNISDLKLINWRGQSLKV